MNDLALTDHDQIIHRAWNLVRSYIIDLRSRGFEDYGTINPHTLDDFQVDDLHDAISDAVTDLLHLAIQVGQSTDTIFERVQRNLDEELLIEKIRQEGTE